MYNDLDDTTCVEDYQWIGIVYKDRDVRPTIALITPLAYYDGEDKKWHTVLRNDTKEYFPNNGR